jgi:hypothetical protein
MDFKQTSFSGGLNLLLEDSRLPVSFKYKEGDSPYDLTFNQYRFASNIRTRFDVATPIKKALLDSAAPSGIKQGIVTFGNYIILFVAGSAYYRLNTEIGWTEIIEFRMSPTVHRYWTVVVPVTTTNYVTQAIILNYTRFIGSGWNQSTAVSVSGFTRSSSV